MLLSGARGYAQTGWKDLMTSYNGQNITYDEIGNPLTYRDGMTMTWTGRQLTTLTQNGKQNTYKYDVDGLRLEKTAGGVTTQYQYVNGQLLGEKRSDGVVLRYTYDALGALSGIQYKNAAGVTTNYIVRCTLSGDVDQIYDTKGNLLARYVYDTWGQTAAILDANGNEIADQNNIAVVNPIRYRGYYIDEETGFYYLQSRYYDVVTKRYINPDGYVYTGQDMQSGNMFAYCGNNPIIRSDPYGGMYVISGGGGSVDHYIYTYTVPKATTSKNKVGRVYIYTGKTEEFFDNPINTLSGFNASTDIMVGDFTSGSNPNMYAYQAYLVDAENRVSILNCLLEYDQYHNTPWERTEESLLLEWQMHHVFAAFDVSAQNVDFDNNEEGKDEIYYIQKAATRGWAKLFG